ncbi:MAG: hypothetical protein DRP51_01140 [Candidatus Zixiibacteriota bacterium]|nr:MAG: hypothetical protein DRP51_01140 [candidate division Zixibacteria bacterium]
MDEKRQSERWKTADYYESRKPSETEEFDVIDLNINQSIGQLVDLNSGGMRLQSEEALEKGVIFKLRIDLPKEVKGSDQLIVDARSLWSQETIDGKYYQTGFEFLAKFPHHDDIIKLLFEKTKPLEKVE